MKILEETLKSDEDFSETVYLDTKNNLTVGWGHKIEIGDRINEVIAIEWLKMDLAYAVSSFQRIPARYRHRLNKARRRVIICMIYNMGFDRVWAPDGPGGFDKMWECIFNEDWKGTRTQALDSKWHNDVGKRAERLADIMESGVWPGEAD